MLASNAMSYLPQFRTINRVQRHVFAACFLGWTLDAFDFFLLTLCLPSIAAAFQTGLKQMAEAIFLTLVMRPVGAVLFGVMAERYGRKPTLMVNVVAFSVCELASAFAPTLGSFMIWRALFGVAMGGEWGVGSALAMETLPAEGRGFFSGLLQEGYVVGNLLAAALYGLLFPHLHGTGYFSGWRVLFALGALPALLAFYLRFSVQESPAWLAARDLPRQRERSGGARATKNMVREYLPTFLFLVVLMTAFTTFSHGTQDLYPAFLSRDKRLGASAVGLIVVTANLGALAGGVFCGALSERLGRRRTIVIASLLAIPMVPMWAWTHSVPMLAVGGFLMQFMVQGAWGVVPAHLNELSPGPMRAVFPGFAYQLGNLFSSRNSVFQVSFAMAWSGGRLRNALSWTVLLVALLVAGVTAMGREDRGAALS